MTGYRCWICETPISSGAEKSLDHVVPLSRGGRPERDNMRPAHRRCNTARGNDEGRAYLAAHPGLEGPLPKGLRRLQLESMGPALFDALMEAAVPLEALRLGATWEIAPEVKDGIVKATDAIRGIVVDLLGTPNGTSMTGDQA